MDAKTYRLVEYEPGMNATFEGGWPSRVIGDDVLTLYLTHNRGALNQGEATYADIDDNLYILTKLRSGHIVGAVEEEA